MDSRRHLRTAAQHNWPGPHSLLLPAGFVVFAATVGMLVTTYYRSYEPGWRILLGIVAGIVFLLMVNDVRRRARERAGIPPRRR